jgi:hypothetical protein
MTQVRNKSGGNLIQKLRFALFFTGVLAVYMRVLVRVVATRG